MLAQFWVNEPIALRLDGTMEGGDGQLATWGAFVRLPIAARFSGDFWKRDSHFLGEVRGEAAYFSQKMGIFFLGNHLRFTDGGCSTRGCQSA